MKKRGQDLAAGDARSGAIATENRRVATAGGPPGEIVELRARLVRAEETLRAIHSGEVDAVVVAGKNGPQVFTLGGAEHVYRVLIESMHEGALTLTSDMTVLYANQCFARMVKGPLEQVIGSSLRRFLSAEDGATLRPLLKRPKKSGVKIQAQLQAGDGSKMPVQIAIRPMGRKGSGSGCIGLVVTDMTEARRTEGKLRALTRRVVEVQEAERGRVALELHDSITQLLCAVLVHSQVLADKLGSYDGSPKREAVKLREMLGRTAEAVERISRELRPSVLDELGLVAVLRTTTAEFAARTGLPVKLACAEGPARLPAAIELTLYRILQKALSNVELHAGARHVTVRLRRQNTFVELTIQDDGIGFDLNQREAGRKGEGGLGLFGMRERAAYVGGALSVTSAHRVGTAIAVRIPMPPSNRMENQTEL